MGQRFMRRRAALLGGLGAVAAMGVAGSQWLAHAQGSPRAGTQVNPNTIFRDPGDPVLGNPNGSLTIAEFFDYRCPFCVRMHPLLNRLLQEDRDIRLVIKEWPVFGGASVTAAKVALAANWQGRFVPVHEALFEHGRALDEAKVRAAAEKAGMDMARLDSDLSGRATDLQASLGRVSMQANALGLQGTPAYVVGPYLVPGAMTYDTLLQVVADARTKERQQR